ncbi:hemocytin-like [Strongylocentrotus purpuratus]|uniref:VWFD domain-containing protein n=1 Tax=Strongylocentrotus purpuratus TaxID=7668 RepID=A0A7M7P650_STRPU|nr:hemocytin-like [Strongylocentrotus purpuratus]
MIEKRGKHSKENKSGSKESPRHHSHESKENKSGSKEPSRHHSRESKENKSGSKESPRHHSHGSKENKSGSKESPRHHSHGSKESKSGSKESPRHHSHESKEDKSGSKVSPRHHSHGSKENKSGSKESPRHHSHGSKENKSGSKESPRHHSHGSKENKSGSKESPRLHSHGSKENKSGSKESSRHHSKESKENKSGFKSGSKESSSMESRFTWDSWSGSSSEEFTTSAPSRTLIHHKPPPTIPPAPAFRALHFPETDEDDEVTTQPPPTTLAFHYPWKREDEHLVTEAPLANNSLSLRTSATCMSWSSDHFVTFDGVQYSFSGTCSYTLAAALDGTWQVTIRNQDCELLSTCYKKLEFILGLDVINVELDTVYINDSPMFSFPYMENGISLKKVGDFTYLESSLGVLAQWDKNMTVYITVLAELKESTIGLCGMYDDNPENDWLMRNGDQATYAAQVAVSWEVPYPGESCQSIVDTNPCDVHSTRFEMAENLCQVLAEAEEFQLCHQDVRLDEAFAR